MNFSRSFIVLAIVGHSYVAMGSSGPAAKVLQDAQGQRLGVRMMRSDMYEILEALKAEDISVEKRVQLCNALKALIDRQLIKPTTNEAGNFLGECYLTAN